MSHGKWVTWMLLAAAWMTIPGRCRSAEPSENLPPITAPPPSLEADAFYKKHLDCGGIPILASHRVADAALRRAAELIHHMLADRPDVRRALVEAGVRYIIIGAEEQTTEIPEYSHMRPKEYVNERSRGFGGRVTSCGEENLLCHPVDRYDDENILIHEFAHVIHGHGLRRIDPQFDEKLKGLYQEALAEGLWKNTYAGSNLAEYWAEGVQSYYDANRQNNWNHNHVNTRDELEAYDPDLARLIAETFRHTPATDWRYRPVAKQPRVTAVPESLRDEPLFKKYLWARGFPVLGSQQASEDAMLEANYLIRQMFAYRHDVLKAMIDAGVRLVIVGDGEDPAGIPACAEPDTARYLEMARRGAVRLPEHLTLGCREQDVLSGPGDRQDGENMLLRRLAVALYLVTGLRPIDEGFDRRPKQQYELRVTRIDVRFDRKLKKLYDRAIERGLWRDTRAARNRIEYWAEGVQSWLDGNAHSAEANGEHNHVNTREELEAYDPDLARFIAEVFLHAQRVDWRWRPPGDRQPE